MTQIVEELSAREVTIRELNSMRARLFTVIESVGLPKGQESAIKSLIKNLSYQNQGIIVDVIESLDDGRTFEVVNGKYQF